MIPLFKDDRTILTEKQSFFINKGLGEQQTDSSLVLDIYETIYCSEKKWLDLNLSYTNLLERLKKSEYLKYLIYRDLKNKGHSVKTGFKFGFDFRIYPKGKTQGQAHSEAVIHILEENEKLSGIELSRLSRLSSSLHTSLLIAIIDSENEINYYSFSRQK